MGRQTAQCERRFMGWGEGEHHGGLYSELSSGSTAVRWKTRDCHVLSVNLNIGLNELETLEAF